MRLSAAPQPVNKRRDTTTGAAAEQGLIIDPLPAFTTGETNAWQTTIVL